MARQPQAPCPPRHFSSFGFILKFISKAFDFQQSVPLFLILVLQPLPRLSLVSREFHFLSDFLFLMIKFEICDRFDLFFVFGLLGVLIGVSLFFFLVLEILVAFIDLFEIVVIECHVIIPMIVEIILELVEIVVGLVDFLGNTYRHLILLVDLLDLHLNELNEVFLMFKLHLVVDFCSLVLVCFIQVPCFFVLVCSSHFVELIH